MQPTPQPMMPTAEGPQDDAAEADGGIELCIVMDPDGALSTYVERGGQQDQYAQAGSIGEALKQILDHYKRLEQGTQANAFRSAFGGQPDPGAGNFGSGTMSEPSKKRMEMYK